MILTLAAKELRLLARNRIALAFGATLLALMLAAAVLGVQRADRFAAERAAAEAADHTVWVGQGERNPHSAAHFARYAFKPVPPPSAFDPGVIDYAGLAIWMEAHYQNPAVFRRAEDTGEAGRLATMSPAWILQVVVPLLIFVALFATVAGEREDGTFKQTLAAGTRWRGIFLGKSLAVAAGIVAVLALAMLVSAAVTLAAGRAAAPSDLAWRMLGLIAVYTAYFACVVWLALGVSALCATRRTAFLTLVGIWAASFILLPRLGAGVAVTWYPEPAVESLREELETASNLIWHDENYQEEIRQALLAEYGVDDEEALPFNYAAYVLQESEEVAHPLFEAMYGRINAIHEGQEGVLRLASLLSPAQAVARLSAGLAGTDRRHHQAFVDAAEVHRRRIILELNEDMLYHAGDAGYAYTAGEALWRAIDDFEHDPPPIARLSAHDRSEAVLVLIYLLAAFAFAAWATARAARRVAAS